MHLRTSACFALLVAGVVLGPTVTSGQARGEIMSLRYDNTELHAYVALPAGDGPAPTIIVIHANRGLGDWTRSVADRLAEHGYIAVAPDLLTGVGPGGGDTDSFADRNAARDAIYKLTEAQVTSALAGVADHFSRHPRSNGKVSVSGFCWGGSQTFRFATHQEGLAAAYVFYGTAPDDEALLAKASAPVYGFYGGNDNRVNATIEPTAASLQAAGKTYDPVIYSEAGHGFMQRGEAEDASEANRTAMKQAWERWLRLLDEHR